MKPFATVGHGLGKMVFDGPDGDAQFCRDGTVAFAHALVEHKDFAASIGELQDGASQEPHLLPTLHDHLWGWSRTGDIRRGEFHIAMRVAFSDAQVIDGEMSGHLKEIGARLLHRWHGHQPPEPYIHLLHDLCGERNGPTLTRQKCPQIVIVGLEGTQQVTYPWLSHSTGHAGESGRDTNEYQRACVSILTGSTRL